MSYVIAEVSSNSGAGFSPRGGALKLWLSKAHEVMLAGPAETGKTWATLQKLDALMWKYPNAQGAIVRKSYASMHSTVLRTYRRIIGKNSPIKAYGGEKPEWFDYPNGSRIFVGGMDNPQKVLSGERDVIYVNQAEEMELNDWETLTTRSTGRGSVMPYTQMIGDCNPGPSSHWIKHRDTLQVFESRHEDNPTLFDESGEITEQGKRTLAILDALTGVRYKRLRLGLWVGAEGMVYEEWNSDVHLIDPFEIPRSWRRYRVIDFGFTNPFVCLWCAEDNDGRLYLYREIYQTHRLVEDVTPEIISLSEGEAISDTISDHDAEDRATAERHGLHTTAANKEVSPGIQAVQARLRVQADGKPRLFIFKNARVHPADETLEEKHKPLCTAEEFDSYVWAKSMHSDKVKEEPRKQDDHGLDALRYLVYHLDGTPEPQPVRISVSPLITTRAGSPYLTGNRNQQPTGVGRR